MTSLKEIEARLLRPPIHFCTQCGGEVGEQIPAADDHSRFVCRKCGFVHYQNPKMVVGCIPTWQDKILLARRSIEPRRGKWTLPAGYLENGETVAAGARRETAEEMGAEVGELIPYALYNMPQIAQLYLMFRAPMLHDRFAAGAESLEVRLFEAADLPWNEIAFKVIHETLRQYLVDREKGLFPFLVGDIYFDRSHRLVKEQAYVPPSAEVEAYFQGIPEHRRNRLLVIHQRIRNAYPEARLRLRYRLPTYQTASGWVALGNQKHYLSLYTDGEGHLDAFKQKHPGIKTGKGCINLRDTDAIPVDDLMAVVHSALTGNGG